MRSRRSQGGFALLITLALVMLGGIALTGLARRSSEGALEVRLRTAELQRRWAVTSLRATLLPRAEALLEESRGKGAPQPELRIACRLVAMDYELVLTDEQAKFNITRPPQWMTSTVVSAAVRRLTGGQVTGRLPPLRSREKAPDSAAQLLEIGRFGQLFEGVAPGELVGEEPGRGAGRHVTCWGDGRVNLHRAPEAVVRALFEPLLGLNAVDSLLDLREQDPRRPASEILREISSLNEEQRATAAAQLSDDSTCHALWVITRDPRRAWYTLAVAVSGGKAEQTQADSRRRTLGRVDEFAW